MTIIYSRRYEWAMVSSRALQIISEINSRKGTASVWTVVYIAPNKKEADKIKKNLSMEGLLVKVRGIGLPHTAESGPVEVLVPESEVDEALEIINSI